MINKPLALGQRWHILYFSILAALFLLFFWPLFSTSHALLKGDYGAQVYPWLHTYAAALKNGGLPLWTDKIQCGFPLFAEGQTAMLYLPHLIFFKLFPFKFAYNALFVGHYALSGIFFYLFCRNNKISVEASIFAVIAYLFGSLSAGGFYGFFSLRPLLWFPLSLLCVDKMLEKRSYKAFFILVISLTQMWVAGYPQMAAYAFLFIILYLGFKGIAGRVQMKIFFWVLSAMGLAVVLSLVQILPTLQLGAHSARVLQDRDFFLWGSINPWSMAGLWTYHLGIFFGSNLYIGMLPLILVMAARWRKGLGGWWFLVAVGVFFALGRWNPFFYLFSKVAIFGLLRVPSKFMFFSLFFLLIIAALELDRLLSDSSGSHARRFVRRSGGLLIFLSTMFILTSIFIRTAGQRVIDFGSWYVSKFILGKSFHRRSAAEYLQGVQVFFESLKSHFTWSSLSFWTPLILGAVSWAIIYLFLLKRRKVALSVSLLLLLCAADLWVYGVKTPGASWVGNVGAYHDLVDLGHLPIEGRWLELSTSENESFLAPNTTMAWDIAQLGAYSPLLDKDYYLLTRGVATLDDSFGKIFFDPIVAKQAKPLVDLMGVRYILSRSLDVPWIGLRPSNKLQDGWSLYKNPDAMDEFNFVFSVKIIQDETERLVYLRSLVFDARHEVVLAQAPAGFLNSVADSTKKTSTLTSVQINSQIHEASIESALPGFLVWSQTMDPGWKAWIDGQPTRIYRANQALMAVRLSEGIHRVRFEYRPIFYDLGVWLYGAGMILCFAGAIYFALLKKFYG